MVLFCVKPWVMCPLKYSIILLYIYNKVNLSYVLTFYSDFSPWMEKYSHIWRNLHIDEQSYSNSVKSWDHGRGHNQLMLTEKEKLKNSNRRKEMLSKGVKMQHQHSSCSPNLVPVPWFISSAASSFDSKVIQRDDDEMRNLILF